MRPRWRRAIVIAPLAIVGLLVFVFFGGVIVKYLWNWLLPPLFGSPQVTFWEALGLLALSRILFGGMGGRGRVSHRGRSRFRQRMIERWEEMTPEERERARRAWRSRWGRCPPEEEEEEKGEER